MLPNRLIRETFTARDPAWAITRQEVRAWFCLTAIVFIFVREAVYTSMTIDITSATLVAYVELRLCKGEKIHDGIMKS